MSVTTLSELSGVEDADHASLLGVEVGVSEASDGDAHALEGRRKGGLPEGKRWSVASSGAGRAHNLMEWAKKVLYCL